MCQIWKPLVKNEGGVVAMGLAAVCDGDISWSYSLAFFGTMSRKTDFISCDHDLWLQAISGIWKTYCYLHPIGNHGAQYEHPL